MLVADFDFNARNPEIVANHAIDVETNLMVDLDTVVGEHARGAPDVVVDVLDDHSARSTTHIPGTIACEGRPRERGGRQRHRNGKFPHYIPLL